MELTNDLLLQIIEHQNRQAQMLGEIQSDIKSLAGDNGRVTQLEEKQRNQWWLTVGITPFLAIAHGIARKLGANI